MATPLSKVLRFYVPARVQSQRLLLTDSTIPESISTFVGCILYLCDPAIGGHACSFSGTPTLITSLIAANLTIKKTRVSQLLQFLCEIGAAEITREKAEEGYTYRQFNLVDILPIQRHYNEAANKQASSNGWKGHGALRKTIEASIAKEDGMFVEMGGSFMPRTESHFQIYDVAMKFSGRDTRTAIATTYHFSKYDFIKINSGVANTGKSIDIAHLSDQRGMRVINGILVDTLAKMDKGSVLYKKAMEDYIYFDLHDFCKAMGMEPGTKNKNIAREMLNRLASTEFRIDATNSPYYLKRFGSHTRLFRYITEFDAVSVEEYMHGRTDVSVLSERYYRVRLHGEIASSLRTEGQSFISHPRLAMEPCGLAHKLNNWARPRIGVRPKQDSAHTYTLDYFHKIVYPDVRVDNFKNTLFTLLKQHKVSDLETPDGRVLVGALDGYIYTLSWDNAWYKQLMNAVRGSYPKGDRIVISIDRDPADEFVGDNSTHNQALRRQKNVAMGFVFDPAEPPADVAQQ